MAQKQTIAAFLAAISLAGATAAGCSTGSLTDDNDWRGSVALTVVPPSGTIITTLPYQITGGVTPIKGTIDASAPGTTQATTLINGLRAGTYAAEVNVTTTSGLNCVGTASFTIVPARTVMVSLFLAAAPTTTR